MCLRTTSPQSAAFAIRASNEAATDEPDTSQPRRRTMAGVRAERAARREAKRLAREAAAEERRQRRAEARQRQRQFDAECAGPIMDASKAGKVYPGLNKQPENTTSHAEKERARRQALKARVDNILSAPELAAELARRRVDDAARYAAFTPTPEGSWVKQMNERAAIRTPAEWARLEAAQRGYRRMQREAAAMQARRDGWAIRDDPEDSVGNELTNA